MTVTNKNLDRAKKLCVSLACAMAHERGRFCGRCGSSDGLQAHHIVPRSRGWRYAADPDNIVILCHECHANLHAGKWQIDGSRVAYKPALITVEEVQRWLDWLEARNG